MKKKTIEIYRYEGLPMGYDYISYDNPQPKEEDVMNEVIKFADGKDVKIYKHLIRKVWLPNGKYAPHTIAGKEMEIARGDEVWYLDIYYQKI